MDYTHSFSWTDLKDRHWPPRHVRCLSLSSKKYNSSFSMQLNFIRRQALNNSMNNFEIMSSGIMCYRGSPSGAVSGGRRAGTTGLSRWDCNPGLSLPSYASLGDLLLRVYAGICKTRVITTGSQDCCSELAHIKHVGQCLLPRKHSLNSGYILRETGIQARLPFWSLCL